MVTLDYRNIRLTQLLGLRLDYYLEFDIISTTLDGLQGNQKKGE